MKMIIKISISKEERRAMIKEVKEKVRTNLKLR